MDVIMQMHYRTARLDTEYYKDRYPSGVRIIYEQPRVMCGLCLRQLVEQHQPTFLEFGYLDDTLISKIMVEAAVNLPAYSMRDRGRLVVASLLVGDPGTYFGDDWPHLTTCPRFEQNTFDSTGRALQRYTLAYDRQIYVMERAVLVQPIDLPGDIPNGSPS